MRIVACAPNHLGDAVLARPALAALASAGRLHIAARAAWAEAVLGDLAPVSAAVPEAGGDAAAVFSPSWSAAWSVRRLPRRVGVFGEGRWLLTEVVGPRGHRAALYAGLAEAFGVKARPVAMIPAPAGSDAPAGHVAVFPTSAGGDARAWGGFAALIRSLPGPVVVYGAPAEAAELARLGATVRATGVDGLLADLTRASVAVGNDSGLVHVARAVGVPVVALFGSTTAARTGPVGAAAIEGRAPCRPCYRQTCARDRACWSSIEVETVAQAVRALRGAR